MASRLFRFLHGGHFRLGAPVCLAPIDLGSLGSATEGLDPSHEAVSVLGTPAEGVLSTAPYEVVRRFVKRALERQVAFVIISGKSFDSNEISLASVEFLGEQFRRLVEGKIQVFWAPTDDIVDEYRESFETLFHGVNLLPPDEAQKTIIRVKGEPVAELYGSCSSAITLGDLAKFADLEGKNLPGEGTSEGSPKGAKSSSKRHLTRIGVSNATIDHKTKHNEKHNDIHRADYFDYSIGVEGQSFGNGSPEETEGFGRVGSYTSEKNGGQKGTLFLQPLVATEQKQGGFYSVEVTTDKGLTVERLRRQTVEFTSVDLTMREVKTYRFILSTIEEKLAAICVKSSAELIAGTIDLHLVGKILNPLESRKLQRDLLADLRENQKAKKGKYWPVGIRLSPEPHYPETWQDDDSTLSDFLSAADQLSEEGLPQILEEKRQELPPFLQEKRPLFSATRKGKGLVENAINFGIEKLYGDVDSDLFSKSKD